MRERSTVGLAFISVALALAAVGCDAAYTSCANVAAQYGPDFRVAGAFDTTVSRIRASTGVSPTGWADLSGESRATLCYLDGSIAKAPPGGEPHDRAVVGVASGRVELLMSGYADQIEVRPP